MPSAWRPSKNLFQTIPEKFRLRDPLNLPGPLSEPEIIHYFRERAAENSRGYTSFLGAGVYNHVRSVVTDALIQRGEFLTSYTPYQAEISQGTLEAIFEFQTLICQLTGPGSRQRLDVRRLDRADRSRADGRAAHGPPHRVRRADACIPNIARCCRPTRSISASRFEKSDSPRRARSIATALAQEPLADVAAVVVQSPNFFGVIEDIPRPRRSSPTRVALCWSSRSRRPSRSASCGRLPRRISWRWKVRASAWRRATAGRTSA